MGMREEEKMIESEISSEETPKGTVQSIKDLLTEKEVSALEATPDGMEFIGWELDGWLASYTLIDDKARPVYAFPRD